MVVCCAVPAVKRAGQACQNTSWCDVPSAPCSKCASGPRIGSTNATSANSDSRFRRCSSAAAVAAAAATLVREACSPHASCVFARFARCTRKVTGQRTAGASHRSTTCSAGEWRRLLQRQPGRPQRLQATYLQLTTGLVGTRDHKRRRSGRNTWYGRPATVSQASSVLTHPRAPE